MKYLLKQAMGKILSLWYFLTKDNQRKFIINCGGHKAKHIKALKKKLDPYNQFFIHTLEPHPAYAKEYKNIRKHKFHQKAIWIYDGTVKLYVQDDERREGHSLCEKKANINPEKFTKVECVDFGTWIKKNFEKDDYIIVRMNIEGAEFKVLDSIIKDGSIEYIDKLLVAFHHKKYPEIANEQEYQDLLSRITIDFEEIVR